VDRTGTAVQYREVDDDAGQRIDNFMLRELRGVPRSRVYRMLRKGEVRVNGRRIRPSYRLSAGDVVRLPPWHTRAGESSAPARPPANVSANLEQAIVFEDADLLVLNKPSGLAVHGGSGVSHGVIELLRHARPDLHELSLAHRLDRETSGCLVLAKRRSALRALHEKFRDGVVEKNYLALALGDWQLGEQLIDAPLLVRHRQGGERYVIVDEEGKQAQTRIKLSRRYGKYSLLQCSPLTGRTHQIRVHAQFIGFPLAGDERYGDLDANYQAKKDGLPRLFLHAQSIAFPDDSGNELHFTAPLADDLERFLQRSLAQRGKRRRAQ